MKKQLLNWKQRLGQSRGATIARLKTISASIFGQVFWSPPSWLGRSCAACTNFHRTQPALTTAMILGVFFFSCGTAWSWRWFQTRPKPRYVSVKVQPIPVTPWKKDSLDYPILRLTFDQSVARLEDLKKTSVPGVRLDPPRPGLWYWAADNLLCFKPHEDWPADQTFRIIFDRKFFPSHIAMERLVYETKTPRSRSPSMN